MQKATIIYNPAARNAPKREQLQAASSGFGAHGWEITIRTTDAAGHAREMAVEEAANGTRVVFACGGDGTINEVVNGLAGSESALAVIRGGMGDVFGKEAHIPRNPAKALAVLLNGEEARIDLGKANERHFLLMAGVGFDGSVVREVPPGPKRILGSTAYALWAAAGTVRYKPSIVDLSIDGHQHSGELYWLLLGNTRSYGGVLNITRRASATDGMLDAYAFEGHGLGWVLATGARLAAGRQDGARGVSYYRLAQLEVSTPGLPVQADGEYFGETPMRFGVSPSALTVRTPRGGIRELLGGAEGQQAAD